MSQLRFQATMLEDASDDGERAILSRRYWIVRSQTPKQAQSGEQQAAGYQVNLQLRYSLVRRPIAKPTCGSDGHGTPGGDAPFLQHCIREDERGHVAREDDPSPRAKYSSLAQATKNGVQLQEWRRIPVLDEGVLPHLQRLRGSPVESPVALDGDPGRLWCGKVVSTPRPTPTERSRYSTRRARSMA